MVERAGHEAETTPAEVAETAPARRVAGSGTGPRQTAGVLALQRAVGNRATAAVLARRPKKKPDDGRRTVLFRLAVDRPMDVAEFKDEFIRQYYSYTTEAEVRSKRGLWTDPLRGTTAKDVAQGFAIVRVTTSTQTDFGALEPEEKQSVNKETDRRFYDKTGIKPGTKIRPQDKELAKQWLGVRNAVLTEDKQRRDLHALPDDIKRILFAGGADAETIGPDDYTQALRIAAKLAALPEDARQDYVERITASTASLDALESSIERYLEFRAAREKQAEAHEAAAGPLLGAEDLYKLYRGYKSLESAVALADAVSGSTREGGAEDASELLKERLAAAEAKLLAALKLKGFDSIAAFETALERYRLAFRSQAVNLALDVLARYEHTLFEERKKLSQPGAAATIASGIAATEASALYATAREKDSMARTVRMGVDPEDKVGKHRQYAEIARYQEEARSARAKADTEVIRGSGDDPLVAERGTDREKLAGLDAAGVQSYLLSVIADRESDIRTARKEFEDDPERVFKLPDLVAATKKLQGVEGTTIYASIVDDHIEAEKSRHLLSNIAVGILAVALAVLVPGGGWVAAAALVGSAGLSTYQAYEAYREYTEQARDYRLHFLAEEPSLLWVGVAIAAAALDLGVVATAVWKASAPALKTLEGPLLKFAKDGDAAALLAKINAAEGLDAKVKLAMARELELSKTAKAAWQEFLGGAMGRTNASLFGFVDPGLAKSAFRALYHSVKRGINTITKLRADAKFLDIAGDITRMSGAQRAELETAFAEVKQLVKTGQARGMDDASLLGYVDRWAINRGNAGFRERLLDEMRAWRPLTQEQQKALGALEHQKSLVAGLYEEKEALLAEREALLPQQKNPATRNEETRKRLLEINKRLTELDPAFGQATKKVRVTVTDEHGEPVEKLVDVPIKHPPGDIAKAERGLVEAEIAAQKAELTLYDRLRAAAPSSAARERALKGIAADQVGLLKTPPTGLQADHVVSVREIADMDGFAKLTWKEQKAIVDMRENLVAMDAAANASKGDRTWRSWRNASFFYDQVAIDAMIVREQKVRELIKAAIEAKKPVP